MSATHATQSTAPQSPVLCMALELSLATWKLAFTVGSGQKPRIRSVSAGALSCLLDEIRLAKKRFGLPEDATVISCYEAGRDGFWIHRFLINEEIQNIEDMHMPMKVEDIHRTIAPADYSGKLRRHQRRSHA